MGGSRPGHPTALRWRVFALLALLACLVIGNTGLSLAIEARLTDQTREKDTLLRTVLVSERLLRTLDGQVSEVRGFALTGERSLLRGYALQRIDELRLVGRLRSLLEDQDPLVDRLERLEAAILEWRVRVADPVIEATRAGRDAAPVAVAADEPLFETVRSRARGLSRGIGRRADEIRVAVEASRERLDRQLLISAGFAVLLVAGSTWGLRRWITLPVARLTAQVRRVAAGNLQEPVTGTGPFEFERLGNDVERMRRRIVDDLERTQRAVEALEQNAPLVASLRSQLRPTPESGLPPGLRIVGRLEPAHGVLAGDWYDVITLDEDRAVLIVVDVCGHGPGAGLHALWLKHLLVPALVMGLEPGDALNWVAGQMGDTGEWFATCVIIEIDAGTGRCRYANAGHPPPLLLGTDGVEQLPATGTLFGALPGQHWETADTTIGSHQMLVVYTDGITETRNASGDQFGDQRLISCFSAVVADDLAKVADGVMESVHAFGSERLKDDATLAVVTFAPRR
ncbi:MAG: SpoIIE family protein phosphatase [Actinomycetota bacterium]|nr:SpoIIE family protein phosphatase [Actinomycetota bacterium]